MYAQLGNIVFEKQKGFTRLETTEAPRFAEIPLAGGKARLQKTGDELTTVNIEARLHTGFTSGSIEQDIEQIRQYIAQGTPLPFTDGAGNSLGNYVITSFNHTPEAVTTQGVYISVLIALALKEWVDPQPELTAARALQEGGFATSEAKVIPVQITQLATTAAALTSLQVQSSTTNSLSAVDDIRSVAAAPAQQATIFSRALAKVEQAQRDADDAITRIQDTATLAAKAPELLDAMISLGEQAALMAQAIRDGDLTNALNQASTLSDAAGGIAATVLPLNISIILRQP